VTRILTRADVAAVLTLDDCIAAVEEVFRAYGERRIAAPQSLGVHSGHGAFHIKTAVTSVFAAKLNANFPGNRERYGLPMIQGVIVVIDPERGTPLGILDSTLITTLRTAAATAVAAKYLARAEARTATIVGCGNQGRAQLEALTRVRPLAKAFAFDAQPEGAEQYAAEMSARLGIEVVAGTSLEEAVAASDVVVTCTPARVAILDQRHLHPGLFIAGVGADNPDKHELAPALLAGSRVVTDITAQAAVQGDLHHAIAAGTLSIDDVHGELADVLAGRAAARTADDEIFVFDSTGTALQDAAAAAAALSRAVERGIGVEVTFA
jgi:ornithine cyclodeaminase/alanine dehydrogenase-like protein (mu-crystallin family)